MFKRIWLSIIFLMLMVGSAFAVNPFQYPIFQVIDADGDPVSGGFVYTYEAGTTTPKIVYRDQALTVPAPNPFELDSKGEYVFYFTDLIKLDVKTSADVQVDGFPLDNLNGGGFIDENVYDSIAALRAMAGNPTDGQAVLVLGYNTPGDGGWGEFYWDETSTDVDNGGTIIKVTAITTGRWLRLMGVSLDWKWFGATGDGVTNDSPFIEACIDVAIATGQTIIPSQGLYLMETSIVKDNFDGLTMIGYGVTVDFQVDAPFKFGDFTVDGSNYYTQTIPTVTNLHIEGFHFEPTLPVFDIPTRRYAYFNPLELSSIENGKIINCSFKNFDFAGINLSARSINFKVIGCTFSADDESNVTYGFRPFCYVAPLDALDDDTGLLLYAAPTVFHENITMEGCTFTNIGRSLISWNVHGSKYINNTFNKPGVRTISVTVWNFDSIISGNHHYAEDNTFSTLSTFIAIGVGSENIKISNEFFMGEVSGISPNDSLKCVDLGGANKNIEIIDCTFSADGASNNVVTSSNCELTATNNIFANDLTAGSRAPFVISDASTTPGFDFLPIIIKDNVVKLDNRLIVFTDEVALGGAGVQGQIIISGNDMQIAPAGGFIITDSTTPWIMSAYDNDFVDGTAIYITDNGTGKTIFEKIDCIERFAYDKPVTGLAPGGTEPISITLDDPQEIYEDVRYLWSAYGNGDNAQPIDEFEFSPTSLTRTLVEGNLLRDAGTASFQRGIVFVRVLYLPLTN